ncbi:MAG: hypothetical protein LC789_12315 [Actinobacteria bacterium]|nr:hypothetical protein [Actinomycetota bacterium]
MHLPERRGRRVLLVEGREAVSPGRPELRLQHRLDLDERQAGVALLQPDQRLPPGVLGVLREERLHRRQQLPGLEGAALQVAEDAPGPVGVASTQLDLEPLAVLARQPAGQALDA